MRRLLTLLAALAVVLATWAGAANADTTGGCSGATQCRTTGNGIEASWYGVPFDGPVLGRVYTDTYVAASTSMTTSRGTKTTGGGLWFSQFSYVFDSADKPTPVSESFVSDFGPDLVISIDGKLRIATASGTVMVVSCVYAADMTETCSDPQPTIVRGTWTGIGPVLQVATTSRVKGPGLTMNDSFHGSQRLATATVTIGGAVVPDLLSGATISDGRSRSISICHVPAC